MGYKLIIGEASIEFNDAYGLESTCSITARPEKHDKAPAFGEPTDLTNMRDTSASVWNEFCEESGLKDVFYDNGELRGGSAGGFPIDHEMRDRVRMALENYKKNNPYAEATYERNDKADGCLCRLIWLDYWAAWAFENCRRPVFANS